MRILHVIDGCGHVVASPVTTTSGCCPWCDPECEGWRNPPAWTVQYRDDEENDS
jgi:hypothetical protein